MTEATKPTNVYAKIAAVQSELAKVGIAKEGNNSAQGYKFRGIDQVYGALSPLLARYGLCILPRIIDREMHERVTIKEWNGNKKESVLFYVTVEAEFDFVSADDGSTHTVRTFGEAMDSGDKATNKAMSAAYKYAALMTFAIPTEGDNDADATTHEVAPAKPRQQAKPAEPIDATQWGIIADLIGQTNTDAGAFCEHYGIAAVKNLPADKFATARRQLNAKLAKIAAEMEAAKGQSLAEELGDEIKF
jgi:hypothetical protein